MKINLSTRPQDIIATLSKEWQMCSDAYVTHHGGREAYDKKQDKWLRMVSTAKMSLPHNTFLWESPDGNKWCAFEHTIYDCGYVHTCHYCFCYYETRPYCGIFFKMGHVNPHETKKVVGFICYGSHFFERLHERNIYEWKGIDTLVQFIADNHSSAAYCTDMENNKWDIRIGHAIGRGFRHKDCPTAYYIKTVLDDEQLSRKQRKETALGRRIGDATSKYIDLPPKAAYEREVSKILMAKKNGNLEEHYTEAIKNVARARGVSVERVDEEAQLSAFIDQLLIGLKPSAYDILNMELSQAVNIEAIWLHDKFFGHPELSDLECKGIVTEAMLRLSKRFGWRLNKGSIIKQINMQIAMAKMNTKGTK